MKQEIEMLSIGKIKPDPNQPRTEWDKHQEHVEELAASYSKHGIIQPLEVDENNVIILGECRWRAAKKIGLKTIPVRKMKGLSQEDRLERQLIDDAQRKTLNDIERRWAYAAAIASINNPDKDYSVPEIKKMNKRGPQKLALVLASSPKSGESRGMAELSRRIGVSESVIGYHLDYFDLENLPNEAREAMDEGLITSRESGWVRAIKSPKAKKKLIKAVAMERKKKITEGKGRRIAEPVEYRVRAIREIERDAEEGKIPKPSDDLLVAAAEASIPHEAARYVAEIEPELQPIVIEQVKGYDAKKAADAAREIASRVPRRPRVEVTEKQLEEIRENVEASQVRRRAFETSDERKEKARLFQSYLALGQIRAYLDDTICPECGKSAVNNLHFACHPKLTIEEAEKLTRIKRDIEDIEGGDDD